VTVYAPKYQKSLLNESKLLNHQGTMDDEGLNISPQELQKLNANDYRELQQFLANEGQKAQVQKSMSRIL
jgi:hypothetical protein